MRMRLPLLLALTLTACQPVPPPKPTPSRPDAVPSSAAIHGRASYLERLAMAPGARLEVQLIDDQGATIAQRSFDGLNGPPYAFDLAYDAAKIDAARQYALRAALRSASGLLQFATDAKVPVVPGDAQRVDLRLVRVALPAARD